MSDDNIADLGQTPAELVILCSGDTSLALLAEAAQQLPDDYPSVRLANPMQVQNHASVDLYVDEVLRHAKVVVIVAARRHCLLALRRRAAGGAVAARRAADSGTGR